MAGLSPAPLRGRSDRELLARWRESADDGAREALLERYLPRARRLAQQYTYRDEPLDDLEQVASIGLVKAIERFDPEQGAGLWTFATPTILGELKRHFRDYCWTVRVPRPMQERALAVQRALGELTGELGRSPSAREVSERLNMSREDVLEALEAGSAYDPRSLDATVSSADPEGATVGDLLGSEDAGLARVERRLEIAPALRTLPERERLILRLRFEDDLTQSEIAERIGISQMHVSRLLRRAIERVREVLRASDGVRAA